MDSKKTSGGREEGRAYEEHENQGREVKSIQILFKSGGEHTSTEKGGGAKGCTTCKGGDGARVSI